MTCTDVIIGTRKVGPVRRGAGSIPALVRISHTVEGAIRTPRPASSPWILLYPQAGFSLDRPAIGEAAFATGGLGVGQARACVIIGVLYAQ